LTSSFASEVDILRRQYTNDDTGLFSSLELRQLGFNEESDGSVTLIYKSSAGERHDFHDSDTNPVLWEESAGYLTQANDTPVSITKTTAPEQLRIGYGSSVAATQTTYYAGSTQYGCITSNTVDKLSAVTPFEICSTEGDLLLNSDGDVYINGNTSLTGSLNASGVVAAASLTTNSHIEFSTTAGYSVEKGEIAWNDEDNTFDFGMGNGVIIQGFQEDVVYFKNNTGSDITEGQVLYINGQLGGRVTVALAQAVTAITTQTSICVATQDVISGEEGLATKRGLVRNLDTSSFSAGDILYVSTTAGELTNTPPAKPNSLIGVALVTVVSASNGAIYVDAFPVPRISQLPDVSTVGVLDNDLLRYNATALCWEPGQESVLSVNGQTGVVVLGFDDLDSHPTTIAGYGITDAYTISDINDNFVPKNTLETKAFYGSSLIFSYVDSNNIDHIRYDDTLNAYHFVSDNTITADGNALVYAGSYYAGGYLVATQDWVTSQGYLTVETDPVFTASAAYSITSDNLTAWNLITITSNDLLITGPSGEDIIYNALPNTIGEGHKFNINGTTIFSIVDSGGVGSAYYGGSEIASQTWVTNQGYTTESWVTSQGYATQSWVTSQGYLTAESDTLADVVGRGNVVNDGPIQISNTNTDNSGYYGLRGYWGSGFAYNLDLKADETTNRKFLISSESGGDFTLALTNTGTGVFNFDLDGQVSASGGTSVQWTEAYSWGDHALAGYATQSWVTSQGYLTVESDTLADVVGRGNSVNDTSIAIINTDTDNTGYYRLKGYWGSGFAYNLDLKADEATNRKFLLTSESGGDFTLALNNSGSGVFNLAVGGDQNNTGDLTVSGDITASSHITSGGTSSDVVLGDGSLGSPGTNYTSGWTSSNGGGTIDKAQVNSLGQLELLFGLTPNFDSDYSATLKDLLTRSGNPFGITSGVTYGLKFYTAPTARVASYPPALFILWYDGTDTRITHYGGLIRSSCTYHVSGVYPIV
jgi:hypothetical protein